MKKQITIFLLFLSNNILAQKENRQIEITPYIRKDWYPEFSYAYNSIDTNHVNLQGISWGISVAYKVPIWKSFFLSIGSGYYSYAFNKMNNYTRRFGKNSERHIDYPPLRRLYIPFFTSKYWYNCIAAKIGVEKFFNFKKDWQVTIGGNIDNYFTYSQAYYITYNNPDNPITNPYKLKNKRFFGFSANVFVGASKRIGRVKIGPSVIVPVFDVWMQDEAFPGEDNLKSRNKWFHGIGAGITCNYLLKIKK